MLQHIPYILETLIQPFNILLLIVGNFVGIIFGAIPGLSGTMAVMLFMPLTYVMDPGTAVVFLMSLWIGGCSGAFIGSVLLGIPGSASAVSTCWDGHPMAQKGRASKALAIGMTASFTGTFLSAIIGCFAAVKMADLAFAMGPWEYTALCLVAMTMVLAISKGNMFKGLASSCIGLLLASVGFSPIDAELRFTFGNMYLLGGLGMVVVLTGIFAVSQIITKFGEGFIPPAEVDSKGLKGEGVGIKDFITNGGTIARSFFIGLAIGFLPGMGAGLSNLVAYATAKSTSKHPEEFGHGAEAGIWAPEVANNAAIGGSLIPMTALAIPGDSTTALLIGALTVHGLEMGPMVFQNSGHIVYLMFALVAVCALVVYIMQRLGKPWFPLILKIPAHYLYSALAVICLCSAYVDSGNLYKCGMMMVFSLVGILMAWGGLPASPLILAFILGPIMEKNMLKAFQYSGTWTSFFTRPISGILMAIAIFCIFSPVLKIVWGKLRKKA